MVFRVSVPPLVMIVRPLPLIPPRPGQCTRHCQIRRATDCPTAQSDRRPHVKTRRPIELTVPPLTVNEAPLENEPLKLAVPPEKVAHRY